MIDTHTHLNFKAFAKDWKEVVDRSIQKGVTGIIVVGTDIESSQRAVEMAAESPTIYASVGIHPHHVKALLNDPNSTEAIALLCNEITKLAQHQKVVAIGEVGLDYHYYKYSKYILTQSTEETATLLRLQQILLEQQIQIAHQLKKPLIMHSREAKQDLLKILLTYQENNHCSLNGVFHCFDGSKKYAKKIIDTGFYISFTGNITYDNGRQDVSKTIPLEKILLETDAPYMTPKSSNLKRNNPTSVTIIAETHAQLRNLPISTISEQTIKNTHQLFNIKTTGSK